MTSFVDISRPIVHPCQLGNFLQFCLILKAKRASAPPKKTREKFLLFQRGEIFNYMKDVILHCLYTWCSFDFDESYCSEGFHFYFARSQTKKHRKFSTTSRAEPAFLKKTVKRQPESCFFFSYGKFEWFLLEQKSNMRFWDGNMTQVSSWICEYHGFVYWVAASSASVRNAPPKKSSSTVFCRPSTKRLTTSTIRLTWFLGLFLYHFLFLSLSKSTALFLTIFLFDESLWRTNKWLPRNRKDTKILPHPCSWSYEMICVCV